MQGFHCISSKPAFENGGFSMKDHQILTMILSAIMWKKTNGPIKLVADKNAIDYIQENNLGFLYDYNLELIKNYANIDEKMFWAGAKLFALKNQKAPVAMIDLDMIVWSNLEKDFEENDICSIHSEDILPNVYKEKSYFKMKPEYTFDSDFDWNIKASNTAFLYIKDNDFKNYYTDEAIKFMENSQSCNDYLSYMVHAEQRMLSMCAKKKNKHIKYFINFPDAIGNQDDFTHIWGFKNILNTNENESNKFCKRLVNRIKKESKTSADILKNNEFFNRYL